MKRIMKKVLCASLSLCFVATALSSCTTKPQQTSSSTDSDTALYDSLISPELLCEDDSLDTEPLSDDITNLSLAPDSYRLPTDESGTLEHITYATEEYSTTANTVENKAYVYLPYGYNNNDTETHYNILYLMHGTEEDETTFLGTEECPTELKYILDNSIQNGDIDPVIVVAADLNFDFYDSIINDEYYDDTILATVPDSDYDRDKDYRYNDNSYLDYEDDYYNYYNINPYMFYDDSVYYEAMEDFKKDLVNNLIPTVENTYHTYAENTTDQGLTSSRNHRAIGGFSMGGYVVMNTFLENLNYFEYFMPMSMYYSYYNEEVTDEQTGEIFANSAKDSGYSPDQYYIFTASGSYDMLYDGTYNQVKAMAEHPDEFIYTKDNFENGNLLFYVVDGNVHGSLFSYDYIYNGLKLFYKQ